jgi:hypothetical protein
MIGMLHVCPRSNVVKGSGVQVKLVFTVLPQFGSGEAKRIVVFLQAIKQEYGISGRIQYLEQQFGALPWAFTIPVHCSWHSIAVWNLFGLPEAEGGEYWVINSCKEIWFHEPVS